MSAHFTTPTDELLLLAETLGEVKTKAEKLEAEFSTQARPLEAATNALSAALSGIKALQFHVLDNNLGALSARVEEMRKAVDEQVGVIALELKKADETNAAKAGQEAEALRSEIAALQAQLGTLGAQFSAQLERVEFSAKEEAKKLQLIPGPAGAAGASLNPRGTFIDGETYNRLDVVSWLGSSYIAAVDGVTEKPSKNSNQWQVLASRGSGQGGGSTDINSILPLQSGNSGKLLTTDGSIANWSSTLTSALSISSTTSSTTPSTGALVIGNGTSGGLGVGGAIYSGGGIFTTQSFSGNAILSNLTNTSTGSTAGVILRLTAGSATASFNLYSSGHSGRASQLWITANGGIVAVSNIDCSGYFSGTTLAVSDGVTAPDATIGQAKIYVDSADGDLKVKFGDGTVKTIATDT